MASLSWRRWVVVTVAVLGHAGDMPVVVNNRCLGLDSAEYCRGSAVAVLRWSSISLSWCNSPVQFLDKEIDGPVVQGVSSILLSWCRGRFPWSREIPLLLEKVIDVPVVQVVLLPRCGPDVQKTVAIPTGPVLGQGDMPVVERQVSWSGQCGKLRSSHRCSSWTFSSRQC